MTLALYPGSFDPIHNGHVEVIGVAARLFDRVVVAAVHNPGKDNAMFSLDERRAMIEESLAHLPNIEVTHFSSLVVELARDLNADLIVKGLRNAGDFEYEMQMALTNKTVTGIDTAFLPSAAQHTFLSSRFIREIANRGGDVSEMVPECVNRRFKERIAR